MDFSPESVYSLLTELGFPVTMEDLKNPTESFMIKFLTEFCQRFHIDAHTLTQLTFEQVEVLKVTGEQNASHVTALLNLSEVISIIGEKIFVKDFSVTDITAPGAKRTRKIIKFLANFALYAEGASIKMQEETDKIFTQAQEIENTKKKSDELKEKMNKKAADMATMMAQIEANNEKSEEIKTRMKRRQEKIEMTRKHNEDLLKTSSKWREIYANKCSEVSKLESISQQLKAKIVDDPSKGRLQLQELQKEQVDKEEKKAATEEAIQQKKPVIQHFEKLLNFIQQSHSKLPDTFKWQKRVMEESKRFEVLDRQLQELKEAVSNEEKLSHEDDEALLQEEVKKYETEHENNLVKLRGVQTKLTSEKKVLEEKIDELRTKQLDFLSELDKTRGKIAESNCKTKEFLKQCKELYNEEIRNLVNERKEYLEQLSSKANAVPEI
ncbi:hypothetical protein G9C98_004629 [Cotesia typhae]|uniref:Kinetochore protein Nuf2 N-terminal domain-containing protein n=1 Tax=Cotesia typhae TaxID=2053667 RepID=A0A8J5QMS5_9HYME|nr:hypothetical protein G9C98_004629 [Cotesia typhae]